MLSRLPSSRFVKREKGHTIHYIYADSLASGCLYVGSQRAYGQFRQPDPRIDSQCLGSSVEIRCLKSNSPNGAPAVVDIVHEFASDPNRLLDIVLGVQRRFGYVSELRAVAH
jgi:hypothetical protein